MSQTSRNTQGGGSRRNSERATRSDTRTGPERMNAELGQRTSRPQSRATEDNRDITEEVPPNPEEQPTVTVLPTTPEPVEPVASSSRQTMPGGLPSFNTSTEPGDQTDPTLRQPTPGRPVRLPNFGINIPSRQGPTLGPNIEEAIGLVHESLSAQTSMNHKYDTH